MDTGFSDNLAISGFAHRATVCPDGSVVYRLKDKTACVRVPAREWDLLREEFLLKLAPSRRRTRIHSILLFPAVLVFALTLGQLVPFTGLIIVTAIFVGPLAIYLAHSFDVRRISCSLEERLRTFPRLPLQEIDKRRFPRALEIAFMLLVGPNLLLAIIGEIGGPDLFRGTPLVGIGIGPFQIAALGLIALRLSWPRLGHSFAGNR